jgi:molybdenum cofactor sulfurtransferase
MTTLTKQDAETQFLAAWPGYESTRNLDRLRETEFARLDRNGHTYLDYTGAGLYAASQVRNHLALLEQEVFGNPHSHNPTSQPISHLIDRVRNRVLAYFNAAPDEYVAIFTANASAALKLVGESYPFEAGDQFLLTFDNHNSVNGIREFARAHHAAITYVPLELPDLRVKPDSFASYLDAARPAGHNLFAYPAQSNFSGVQHPLDWIATAQAKGWDVLLDAAAFVPTNRLDLSLWHPDFVSLSFYKMFGYPTGTGCLLARRDALARLRRPWFAGGTITVASVQGDRHFLAEGPSAFEDGTLDYLNLPAVEIGLQFLEDTGTGHIHTRCACLAAWLIEQLSSLRHRNGSPLIRLYGPSGMDNRGATVTMNFYDPQDAVIDHLRVEELATAHGISLRTGCFCNPGGGETALHLSKSELIGCFSQPRVEQTSHFTVDDFRLCVDGKSTGAVRVSFGIASNFDDAWRYLDFAREFLA